MLRSVAIRKRLHCFTEIQLYMKALVFNVWIFNYLIGSLKEISRWDATAYAVINTSLLLLLNTWRVMYLHLNLLFKCMRAMVLDLVTESCLWIRHCEAHNRHFVPLSCSLGLSAEFCQSAPLCSAPLPDLNKTWTTGKSYEHWLIP